MNFDYYINYFKVIEERLMQTQKYVAFTLSNIDNYSIEFSSIISDCANLINGFCVDLCKEYGIEKEQYNITDYKKVLKDNYNNLLHENICFNNGFILRPWERVYQNDYKVKASSPLWWNEYNAIKHSGESNFHKATLKNAISCVSGMFGLLVAYDFKRLGCLICNWRGYFYEKGNCRIDVSWEC